MRNKQYLFKTIKRFQSQHYDNISLNGFEFSVAMQDLLIPEDTYVIDTGSYKDVNQVVLRELTRKIEKHPIIWSIFFMVK